MKKLRVAVGQMPIDDGCYDENFRRIEDLINKAGPSHDLIVLPETATSGFSRYEEVAAIAEPLDGPTVTRLTALAARHSCIVVVGLAEREGINLFNTAVVVGPGGPLMSYRKTHLWSADRAIFKAGDRFKRVATRTCTLGAMICYDVEFPEPARVLASMGADVIALCNGNMNPYGEVHRRAIIARAQENQIFVAMANRVGRGRDDSFAGGSIVVAPDGSVLVELGDEEGIASVDIDLDQIEISRQRYCYLSDRRFAIEYGAIRSVGDAAELDVVPRSDADQRCT